MVGLLLILCCMFAAFVYLERYPKHHPALVAFATLLTLVIFNYIPADKAFSGLSNRAALTVMFTLFCAQAFECSGGVDALGLLIKRFSKSNGKILFWIYLVCTGISGFINNISAMYLTLPLGKRACRANGISSSVFVMPLAFCALIGGTLTIMGTPPNMIIAARRNQELGMNGGIFYDTPLALIVGMVALTAIYFLSHRMLPNKKDIVYSGDFDKESYLFVFRIRVSLGKSIEDLFPKSLKDRPHGIAVRRAVDKHIEQAGAEDILLGDGDIVVLKCSNPELSSKLGDILKGERLSLQTLEDWKLLHVVYIDDDSHLIGSSPEDENLGATQDIRFLAVATPSGTVKYTNVGSIDFEAGASYLVLAKREKIMKFTRKQDLPSGIETREFKVEKWRIALSGGMFLAAIMLANFSVVSLEIALGVTLLINYLCGNLNTRYKIIVDIILMALLVALMIPIGNTIEETGAAKILAEFILNVTSMLPMNQEVSALLGILLASILIANFIDNSATALIMLPIAISAAKVLGVSPNPYFSAIMIGVSTTMMLPIGHNCTILAQRECKYSTLDFVKFGGLVTIVIVITTMIAIPVMYKF